MKRGFIAGCFDVLHPGYIKMFKEAKENCDYLIVALQDNPNQERLNKLKPILSIDDRKEILESIRYIDKIIPYTTEKSLENILIKENPDVRFLGDDYIEKDITGKELNIPIIFLNRNHGWSSTKFKKQIYEQIKYIV